MEISYQLEGFERNRDGSFFIFVKEKNNPRHAFRINIYELINSNDHLLEKFSKKDIVKILGLAYSDHAPNMSCLKTGQFKYFSLLSMIFGCCLIVSNIASFKVSSFFNIPVTGGTIPYLITYALGDIITEVYGYQRSRQLIWGSIISNFFFVLFLQISIFLQPDPTWNYQKEYQLIFGLAPRIFCSSMIGYFLGEFLNAYIISKLKIIYNGNVLWLRVIWSSLFSMVFDNYFFIFISYYGVFSIDKMILFANTGYISGIVFEWTLIPLIIFISNKLKKIENCDVFDLKTNFNPFSLKTYD